MALYKDTHRCHKCGETFTWYYQPEQESYLQVVHDDGKSAAVERNFTCYRTDLQHFS